ncbi:MAG: PEGA domain-containing protein [Bacteroidia bacterium]|nr:PEGA domain-containing protein [Bacteroidia bacterium]
MRIQVTSILLLITLTTFSQDLKVGEFKSLPLDVSARENPVLDVNGIPCALIKVRTGLNNVSFFSNLALEKTEHRTGEYWVWVSPGTTQLRIAVQDFPLLDYKLPELTEERNVYEILLIATFPEKIIYRDTFDIQSLVSFITEPQGANVYINNLFYGITPLKVNIADIVFSYKIEKERFLPVSGNDTIKNKLASINLKLEPNFRVKRYFIAFDYGINTYINKDETVLNDGGISHLFGFSIGRAGKTGYYLSAAFCFKNIKPDFEYIRSSNTQIPYKNTAGYYYSTSGITLLSNKDHFNLFRIDGGITQQISKRAFLFLGTGYSQLKFFKVFIKEPYDILTGTAEPLTPQSSGTAYGLVLDESFKGFNIDMGLHHRFGSSILISLNYTINFSYTKFANSDKYGGLRIHGDRLVDLLYPDIKIGIGYLF